MPLKDHITGEIRAEMARRRLNQTDMAQRLGMSQAAFSRHLNGVVPMTLDFVEDVARELGVPVSQLLSDPPESGLTAISADYAMLGVA